MLKVDATPPRLTTHAPDSRGYALCGSKRTKASQALARESCKPGNAVLREHRTPTSGASLTSLRKAPDVRAYTPHPSCPHCQRLVQPKRSVLPTRKTFAPYQGAWR